MNYLLSCACDKTEKHLSASQTAATEVNGQTCAAENIRFRFIKLINLLLMIIKTVCIDEYINVTCYFMK